MAVPDIDTSPLYLSDRAQVAAANDLIIRFGVHAVDEAEMRAARSRDVGNHIHFCRWRQIGRLIDVIATGRVTGTIH